MCASRSSGAMAFEEISSLAASIFPFGSREFQSPERSTVRMWTWWLVPLMCIAA